MALNPSDQDKRGVLLANFDGSYTSAYPNGDKPQTPIDPTFKYLAASGGSDAPSSGSFETPYATLEYAQTQMVDGDGLYLLEGVHNVSQDIAFSTANQTFADYPLNVTRAIVDCQNTYEGARVSANNVSIIGLHIRNFRGNGGCIFGNVTSGLAQDVLCTNGRALFGGNLGGFVLSNTPSNVARNVSIINCRADNVYVEDAQGNTGTVSQSNASGLYSYAAENCTIQNFTGSNTGQTIFFKRSTGLAGNVCDKILGFNIINGYRLSVAGGGDPIHYQQYLSRFIFHDVTSNGIYLEIPDTIAINDTINISNGVIKGGTAQAVLINTQNFEMFNVIFAGSSQYCIAHRDTMVLSANDINDNLYYLTQNFVYNQYAGNEQNNINLATWKTASSQDTNSDFADPQFEDYANNDFRLANGSPYIGAGRNGKNYGAYREGDETIGATT